MANLAELRIGSSASSLPCFLQFDTILILASHPLKSPMTKTCLALGAQTAKCAGQAVALADMSPPGFS